MKNIIIGLLIGAVISIGSFYTGAAVSKNSRNIVATEYSLIDIQFRLSILSQLIKELEHGDSEKARTSIYEQMDSDIEVLKTFLDLDPSLSKKQTNSIISQIKKIESLRESTNKKRQSDA